MWYQWLLDILWHKTWCVGTEFSLLPCLMQFDGSLHMPQTFVEKASYYPTRRHASELFIKYRIALDELASSSMLCVKKWWYTVHTAGHVYSQNMYSRPAMCMAGHRTVRWPAIPYAAARWRLIEKAFNLPLIAPTLNRTLNSNPKFLTLNIFLTKDPKTKGYWFKMCMIDDTASRMYRHFVINAT